MIDFEQIEFIDLHYHVNPDLYERRYNAISAGQIYKQMQGAVLLKSHLGSSVEVAHLAQQQNLPVLGSIVLNHIAGGVSVRSVLAALGKYNCYKFSLLVSFPTHTNNNHVSKLQRKLSNQCLQEVAFKTESVSENGKLKASVIDLLKLGLDYPISFSTGHALKKDVLLLAEAAYKIGLKKLLITQPANPITGFTGQELHEIVDSFDSLWIEQTALTYILGYQSLEDFSYVISKIPRVIYSSDLGQNSQMDIKQWYNTSINWFKQMHLSDEHIKLVTKNNPYNFIRL